MGTHDPVVAQNKHPRSMTHSSPYYTAVAWSVLNLLCNAATVIIISLYFYDPSSMGMNSRRPLAIIIGGVSICLLTFVIAFIKRRNAKCPLCKGTPLLNTGARPHVHAVSVTPFNHGYTAVLSILLTQKVCCMYCGTKYDLLKTSGHKRRRDALEEETLD